MKKVLAVLVLLVGGLYAQSLGMTSVGNSSQEFDNLLSDYACQKCGKVCILTGEDETKCFQLSLDNQDNEDDFLFVDELPAEPLICPACKSNLLTIQPYEPQAPGPSMNQSSTISPDPSSLKKASIEHPKRTNLHALLQEKEIVDLKNFLALQENRAIFFACDQDGNTVLHTAAIAYQAELVVQKVVDVLCALVEPQNQLASGIEEVLASYHMPHLDHKRVIAFINQENSAGKTALMLAIEAEKLNAALILLGLKGIYLDAALMLAAIDHGLERVATTIHQLGYVGNQDPETVSKIIALASKRELDSLVTLIEEATYDDEDEDSKDDEHKSSHYNRMTQVFTNGWNKSVTTATNFMNRVRSASTASTGSNSSNK